jgi:fatty acid synthase subunit alpha, fungi type
LHSDKAGRSVPAPGRGALTIARETPSKHPLPLLNIDYRARQLSFRRNQISQWLTHEQQQLKEEIEFAKTQGDVDEEYFTTRIVGLEKEAARQEKDALGMYGMLEGQDPHIAPLRRALAVWGLSVDDIGTLSIHGTSTKANVRD